MIKRKEKICKHCKLPKLIFSKGLCLYCYGTVTKPQIKSKGAVKRVSEKGKERTAQYNILRLKYLETHPICEVCGADDATEIHHKAGRVGENLFKHFLGVSRECHNRIHSDPEEAIKQGWIIPTQ